MKNPAVSLAALALFSASTLAKPELPNIIVILSDDVGWGDLGCYGATRIKTPHLDLLASQGLRFTRAYASASACTPTRYSMLTGQYSWRVDAMGLNKGVANADAPLLIPVNALTLPKMMKTVGYRTGVVGKWHLGFGDSKPDYNQPLTPGPLEIGFDSFFGFPATNDRIPTVFIRDRHVLDLDPADPLKYTYDATEAAAGGFKKVSSGRSRIGWVSGGVSAQWKDVDLTDTLTCEAVAFIEQGGEQPFFLYYAPHNVHAPVIPHPRFAGSSGLSKRADTLVELDASIGALMKTLDRLGRAENTLIFFSSDNGAYIEDEDGHRPNGPLRGAKSQLWEGGFRVPLIARWPGKIAPGVSDALVCLVDLPATAAALVGAKLTADAAPDSYDILPILRGRENPHPREHLILMSGKGDLAIRQGKWKYIPDLASADGWRSWKKKGDNSPPKPGLYDLSKDEGESKNLHATKPEVSKRLAALIEKGRSTPVTRP